MLYTKALREAIGTEDERTVRDAISKFSCKDKDVEYFLKNKSFEFEKRDKSRTYLVIDDETQTLLAYFTLSLKSLEFRDTLSKSKVKDIDGFSKEVKGVAIALVGQFGKDETMATEVSGARLFNLCMEILYQVHTLIGGRYVLIECQNTAKSLTSTAQTALNICNSTSPTIICKWCADGNAPYTYTIAPNRAIMNANADPQPPKRKEQTL
jgi:hypothetical protein